MNEFDHARFLLAVLRERWDEARALTGGRPVEAEPLIRVCFEADVSSWVLDLLTRADQRDLVSADALERLEAIRSKIRVDNLLLIARAEEAVGALLNAGVVPVALKGLDLLYRVYESFDARTLDDVDLLVRREDLTATLDALRDAGWELPPEPKRTHYIRSSHHLPLRSPGPVSVDFEIHWNLVQEMRYHVDESALIDRAVPLDVGGHRILRMDDHDLIAHLLLHHFTHYFDRRLKWAIDLKRITVQPGFDWDVVGRRIRSWGAVAATGASLLHLHKLFPEWIPPEILRHLPLAAWRRNPGPTTTGRVRRCVRIPRDRGSAPG